MAIYYYVDENFDDNPIRYYSVKGTEIGCTLVAMWGVYTHSLSAETRELALIHQSTMEGR
jgi:hypothetical protein